MLFGQGDPPGPVFSVHSGSIKLGPLSEDGQETALALAQPGDVIGEMSALDRQPRSASAIVAEAGEAGILPREDFVDYLHVRAARRLLRLSDHSPATLQLTQEALAQMVAPHRISVRDPEGLYTGALL